MVGFGFSAFTASLVFKDDAKRDMHQRSASMTIGRSLDENWLLRVSVAGLLAGEVRGAKDLATFGAGGSIGVSLSRIYAFDNGLFLGAAYSFASSYASARYAGDSSDVSLLAFDLRASGQLGYTLWHRVTPYVAGRVYGGPVFWQTERGGDVESGTDAYHVLLAGGVSVRTPTGLYITVEAAPGGEQVVSVEVGARL